MGLQSSHARMRTALVVVISLLSGQGVTALVQRFWTHTGYYGDRQISCPADTTWRT